MNSLNCFLLIMSSVLAMFLLDKTTAAAPNDCVFQCVKGVIKCNRKSLLGRLPPGFNCCKEYDECYIVCKPEATSFPPCKQKQKRGSWNKRFNFGVAPRSQYISPQGQGYDTHPSDFLFDQQSYPQ